MGLRKTWLELYCGNVGGGNDHRLLMSKILLVNVYKPRLYLPWRRRRITSSTDGTSQFIFVFIMPWTFPPRCFSIASYTACSSGSNGHGVKWILQAGNVYARSALVRRSMIPSRTLYKTHNIKTNLATSDINPPVAGQSPQQCCQPSSASLHRFWMQSSLQGGEHLGIWKARTVPGHHFGYK